MRRSTFITSLFHSGLVTLAVLTSGTVSGQGLITTLAGTGYCSFSGDGGPASAALLCNVRNSAADAAGNVYFGDNFRIRRITPQGVISTIAGNGSNGGGGDGGPALLASIGFVDQLTVLPAGRLCFGDSFSYKLRCVNLGSGMIEGFGTGIYAYAGDGGHVSAASFNPIQGIASDEAGNIFVSDLLASAVRRVDAITGIVTTIVGPGPGFCCLPLGDGGPALGANILQPWGLFYRSGTLYIADTGNARVRAVNLATGIINTIAGNGSHYYSGDGGSAVAAGLSPRWLTGDASGNLFLNTAPGVRMIDSNGFISSIVGTMGVSYSYNDDIPAVEAVIGPSGLGWDPVAKRLLIADNGGRLRQVFFTPPTATSLSLSPNPAVPLGQVTMQATVQPAGVTGVVRFHAYPFVIATVPLTPAGTATYTWTTPLGGSNSYAIRAVYGGDPTHNLSVSSVVNESVQQGATSTALVSSVNPSLSGQTTVLTATVAPAAATGTVFFYDGQLDLGSAPVGGGVATLSVSNLSIGTHSIRAWFGNTVSYLGSTSPLLTQNVQKLTSSTTLASNRNPSVTGQSVIFTASVTPVNATGTVQFNDGAQSLGFATIANGTATLATSALSAGVHPLQAVYSGDGNTNGGASNILPQTVKTVTAMTIASNRNPANSGQPVTFTAAVSPVAATGPVMFFDGATLLTTTNLTNGVATFSTKNLAKGIHLIRAAYGGNANYGASDSPTITQTIR